MGVNMKVADLVEMLLQLDQDLDVIIQKDSEGNGYEPVRGVEETMINEYGEALHPEDYKEHGVNQAVVIFP